MAKLPTLIGRSSSHFTRVTRVFAAELALDYSFQVVLDLTSGSVDQYGGNPALKVPVLVDARGTWFGALNICREMSRTAPRQLNIVWPDAHEQALVANAQELTTHAMSTEVALIMSKVADPNGPRLHEAKLRKSLLGSVEWLNTNLRAALGALPPNRDLSFLEVALFCLVTHLEFRDILPTRRYSELVDFCTAFGERPSALATTYRFDS